jgi:hypothetical protein
MWDEDACGCRLRAGARGALSGCERSASRQSRAGQKAVVLPPECGQAAQGTRKLKPSPVSDFARRLYMLMNLGQRDEPPTELKKGRYGHTMFCRI